MNVLFVCTANGGRSVMAERLLLRESGGRHAARSAGSMPGAALGGLVIGFLSAWSDQYISARWTNAIVFSILIIVLVFRPHGLLGERTPDKA